MWELFLSFHHGGPRNGTWTARLGPTSVFTHWDISMTMPVFMPTSPKLRNTFRFEHGLGSLGLLATWQFSYSRLKSQPPHIQPTVSNIYLTWLLGLIEGGDCVPLGCLLNCLGRQKQLPVKSDSPVVRLHGYHGSLSNALYILEKAFASRPPSLPV